MENDALRTILFQMDLSRRRLLQPWFSSLGLTLGQGQPRILARLLQGDGLTQRELADECMLDAATLSRALDRLEEMGLIRREEHPGSRRSYLVRLTDAGREKAAKVQEGFEQLEELLCQGFSPDELERLQRDLEHIRANLDRCETLFGGKST
ncbi:MAG: MarR family transcriptional regulator [Pseudoflavonifractor capillosus]|uniref:MarR family winged helix-turn-helix transcriptional regulator n=1 Tax=Pseudoflavonifractor capillosus TaxID=106588 RepID=UPI0023F82442|nr:MarR family transcriptional regulator [Pseudoflavonifractor capillosus]MCI5928308.1 MarR family transcriptional regulator [Pseudoflavonifractor capillosus]MDY4660248.1 MarR family transcriptional regulator [Pseudoflavonifractor capillosus]